MDILYYWKSIESDLKTGKVGHLKSDKDRMESFKAGFPDFIWIIKTPQGRVRDVELLAKLVWKDAAAKGFSPTAGQGAIHYDPRHSRSVMFDSSTSKANIEKTSNWMRRHFPNAVRANFIGSNGQQELRGEALRELQEIAARWLAESFMQANVQTEA